MAGTTLLTIGAEVSCTDGPGGKLSRVVIDPRARTVTHLVVNGRRRTHQDTGLPNTTLRKL